MDASIAIFEWVNIDEPEREHRCSDNRIEIFLRPMVEGYQSCHKRGNILMARVNMIWDRLLRVWSCSPTKPLCGGSPFLQNAHHR